MVEVLIHWELSPPDYLGEIDSIQDERYTFLFNRKQVEVQVSQEEYQSNPKLREELTERLQSYLDARQILTHERFLLRPIDITFRQPDGRCSVTVLPLPVRVVSGANPGRVIIRNRNGSPALDSFTEQQETICRLGQRLYTHRADSTLKLIVHSYREAVADPKNELLHLYEIQERLRKQFGGKGKKLEVAARTLGVEELKWKHFLKLSDGTPVRQGRHRGSHDPELRSATHDELRSARNFGRSLIEKYLDYLDVHTEK